MVFPLALEVDKGIFVNYVNDTVIALSELTNHPISSGCGHRQGI